MTYIYRVKRGPKAGVTLYPHKHQDGRFVASKTRFEEDYIRVPDAADLDRYVKKGYSVRMSAPGLAPSLISPASLSQLSSP